MNKKRITITLLVITAVAVLICGLVRENNDVKTVFSLPPGFIPLEDVIASSEGVLSCVFWESQISLLNSEGTCVYQTSVRNSNFIVKYNGKNYINEFKYNELLKASANFR
jgi:hypothetical protein